MKVSKSIQIAVAVILMVVVIGVRLYRPNSHGRSKNESLDTHAAQARDADPPSDRHATDGGTHQEAIPVDASLILTKHAKCRMACRHISEEDIREVLREGHVNDLKSKPNDSPCPSYAIEDVRNSDGIRLRIVFAKCGSEVKVVTCIDRDDEYSCDCK